MKVRDVIHVLTEQGFNLDRQKGSHRQFKGIVDGETRLVTVPGNKGDDIPKGTLSAIVRQAGLPSGLFR